MICARTSCSAWACTTWESGIPRRARGCLEKAADLHCKAHIIPCHHVARDLALSGDLSLALAEWNIADGYYLRAQRIYQRYHGAYDAALAAVLAKRGTLASSRARFDRAKEWCEKALEIDLRASKPHKPQPKPQPQASIAGTLAPAWQTVLKPEALRKKVDSFWTAKESNKTERRNPDSSAILRAYGNVLLDRGRPWEHRVLAEAQFTEAHKIDLIMLKAGHPFEAQDLAGLGRVREILGAYPESADHYARALGIDEVAYGPHHPQVAEDLRNLAHALVHDLMHSKHLFKRREYLERLEGAKNRALRARDIDAAALGKQHPNVAWDLVVLGQAFFAAGRLAEAEATLNEACGIAARAYGGQHPWVADITGQWLSVIQGTWPSGTP